MAVSESVKDFFKWQILKEPKLVQLDQVPYKWFITKCTKWKPLIGSMITEKAKYFYDEMKITDKCTPCEGWQLILKIQELKKIFKWNIPLISCAAQVPHQ